MRAKSDSKLSIYDNWLIADPLNSAWFHFAEPELQDQYRDAGRNPARTAFLDHQMKSELIYNLGYSDLIAVGVFHQKRQNPEPEWIAKSYFAADQLDIDWDKNEICAFGDKIDSVRILVTDQIELKKPTVAASKDSKTSKNKGGRKSSYPVIREILLRLFEQDEIYREASSESLIDLVNVAFKERYADTSIRVAPISPRALRNHLKKLRKELAETGKN